MLNINAPEFLVLLVLVLVVVGPQRLPEYAETLASWVRQLRDMAVGARETVRTELGPDFDDIDWAKFDPRQYDPRKIVKEALLDGWDEPSPSSRSARERGASREVSLDKPGAAASGGGKEASRAPGAVVAERASDSDRAPGGTGTSDPVGAGDPMPSDVPDELLSSGGAAGAEQVAGSEPADAPSGLVKGSASRPRPMRAEQTQSPSGQSLSEPATASSPAGAPGSAPVPFDSEAT